MNDSPSGTAWLQPARGGAPTVVVLGGGFTGASVAYQLARRAPGDFRIIIVEPRGRLGGGVAYSTVDPAHRINVPASRMSLIQSDPCHFDRWLKADGALRDDPAALTPDGRAFPRRQVFGRYVAESLEPYLLSGDIEHVCLRATALGESGGRRIVTLSDGSRIEADYVVLAATHPLPAVLPALRTISDDPRLIRDAQGPGALDAVAPDARVLIVGTGLTMADIVASLDRRGHRGPILAVSRRGLLPRGHTLTPGEFGVFTDPPSRTVLNLLVRIRRAVAEAARDGHPWHHVLDAVRTQGPAIWAALPARERAKLVRRLRSFWDVHRFRVAPQLEAVLDARQADGTLRIVKGEPVSAEARADGLAVAIRPRGRPPETHVFDAVVLATGPAHRSLVTDDALIAQLAADGAVRLDDFGLGLSVDERSRAIGTDGAASPTLWIAGPLARGTFGELMGLPEVARHAEGVAGDIIKSTVFGYDYAA